MARKRFLLPALLTGALLVSAIAFVAFGPPKPPIKSLADQSREAEAIAQAAWEQSVDYTHNARASCILELVDEVWERRHVEGTA